MTPAATQGRQGLIAAWLAQMIGTLVLAAVVIIFVRTAGAPFATEESDWKRYAMLGIIIGVGPALLYLRTFRARLDEDDAVVRRYGAADPAVRALLMKSLSIGGALCEIPMAMGVVQLFFGGETRWFIGATLITIALRLSYRPYLRR